MAYNSSIFTKGTVTYRDLDISMRSHPFTGDLRTKTDLDAIKQSLLTLLYTNFGERPFRPNLGSNLDRLLFEPLDQITTIELGTNIKTVIQNWEPRIRVLDIQISGEDQDNNAINITLTFSMLNISAPQKISLILKRVR